MSDSASLYSMGQWVGGPRHHLLFVVGVTRQRDQEGSLTAGQDRTGQEKSPSMSGRFGLPSFSPTTHDGQTRRPEMLQPPGPELPRLRWNASKQATSTTPQDLLPSTDMKCV